MNQHEFMRIALDLANENARSGHGAPFGALVVKNVQIIGSGVNEVAKTNDLTNHAEIQAIRQACHTLQTTHLKAVKCMQVQNLVRCV